jgi:anti-anti-sigma factor
MMLNGVEALDADDLGELRRRVVRLQLLAGSATALAAAGTPTLVAAVVVERFAQLLGTPSVAVFELRGVESLDAIDLGGWVQGARDAWTTMPLDAPAPVADAARTRSPVWSESASEWRARYPHLLEMLDGYGYTGVLGLPLVAGAELVGALGIGFAGDRTLDVDERDAATALAEQSAYALQRARIVQDEGDARRAAERLTATVAALSRARTLAQVGAAIGEAVAAFGATGSVVAVCSATPGRLDLLGTGGDPPVPDRMDVDAAHPLAHCVRTGEPVWLARRSELAWRERSFADTPGGPAVDVAVPMWLDDRPVGAIGMAFPDLVPRLSTQERRAVAALAGQCAQALDRARLQQVEHDIAEALQRSLLPDRLPEIDRLSVAARYLPGAEGARAGGDWYDVVELDGPRVAIVVGDVVGKGAVAAGLMGRLRTALAAALLRGDGPADALAQLDRFCARIPTARASTAACVLLDWQHHEARWAGAGHPPPLLVGGEPDGLLPGAVGPALGLSGDLDRRFVEHTTPVPPGSTLVLYTDGLVERRGERLDQGLARLAGSGRTHADLPPGELADALLTDLLDDTEPADDVAVVVTRLVPPPWQVRIPADPRQLRATRRAVEAWTAAAGLDPDQADDLQLALGEAVANAIEHGYRDRADGVVGIDLTRHGDGAAQVAVEDAGRWRPPPEDPGHRGRGLGVIRKVATDVELDAEPSGTRIAFRVPAGPARAPVRHRELAAAARPVDASVTVAWHGTDVVVALAGEIDLDGADLVRDALRSAVTDAPPGGRVVLDLTATRYLASAGVALLVDGAERARVRGVGFATRAGSDGAVARVLELTGLGAVLGLGDP